MGAILYSFRRCPFAMRARLALARSGLVYEHREILLRDKPASMLAYSPKGTVPVFINEDGQVLDESFDIMVFALGKSDPDNWLRPDLTEMTALTNLITGPFKTHLDRYKYANRYNKNAARQSIDLEHRERAIEILKDFDQALARAPYLMGEHPALADYATFPFIRQFANVEPDWWHTPVLPHIHRWLEYFTTSDLFNQIMQKHKLWSEGE